MTFTPEQRAELRELKREIVHEFAIMLRPLLERIDNVHRVGNHAEERAMRCDTPSENHRGGAEAGAAASTSTMTAAEHGARLGARLRQRRMQRKNPPAKRSAGRSA